MRSSPPKIFKWTKPLAALSSRDSSWIFNFFFYLPPLHPGGIICHAASGRRRNVPGTHSGGSQPSAASVWHMTTVSQFYVRWTARPQMNQSGGTDGAGILPVRMSWWLRIVWYFEARPAEMAVGCCWINKEIGRMERRPERRAESRRTLFGHVEHRLRFPPDRSSVSRWSELKPEFSSLSAARWIICIVGLKNLKKKNN